MLLTALLSMICSGLLSLNHSGPPLPEGRTTRNGLCSPLLTKSKFPQACAQPALRKVFPPRSFLLSDDSSLSQVDRKLASTDLSMQLCTLCLCVSWKPLRWPLILHSCALCSCRSPLEHCIIALALQPVC